MRTDEEGAGKGPFLGAADDGEREPVGGDEGMQQRHRRNPPDGRQIRSTKTLHLHFVLLFFLFPFFFLKKKKPLWGIKSTQPHTRLTQQNQKSNQIL